MTTHTLRIILFPGAVDAQGAPNWEQCGMDPDILLSRITANPSIFGGKPIIRGMRISVELVLSLLAQGASAAEILDDYPELERDDVLACLAYARAVVANGRLDGAAVGGR